MPSTEPNFSHNSIAHNLKPLTVIELRKSQQIDDDTVVLPFLLFACVIGAAIWFTAIRIGLWVAGL